MYDAQLGEPLQLPEEGVDVLAVGPDVEAVLDRLFDLLVVASDGRAVLAPARARLDAIGRAYIEFARTEPGWSAPRSAPLGRIVSTSRLPNHQSWTSPTGARQRTPTCC
jgi:hypothetical protein